MKHIIYENKNKNDGTIRCSTFTLTYTQDVLVTATETATCCCYDNTLVISKGGCYFFLFSTTKSLFDFSVNQAYHTVSQIAVLAVSNVSSSTRILVYIQIGTKTATFWCGGYIIIFIISIFKFGFPFSLESSHMSLSRKLEYEDEEHHK